MRRKARGSRKASARFTAVVDFADAALAGRNRDDGVNARRRRGGPRGRHHGHAARPGRGPRTRRRLRPRGAGLLPPWPALRSAVSATMTDVTPGKARTAASAALRTGSHCWTTAASTLIEKNTLPSLATISDSAPGFGQRPAAGRCDLAERRGHLFPGRHHHLLAGGLKAGPAESLGPRRARSTLSH